jgi:hypothetical protein
MRADDLGERLRTSLTLIRAGLPLAHDGEAGAREVLARVQVPRPRHRLRSRAGLLIAATVVLGGAGAASAAVLAHDGSAERFFSQVPQIVQQKANGGRAVPSPTGTLPAPGHVLVASVPLTGGRMARVYVTSAAVDSHGSRCFFVEQLLVGGGDGGSMDICGAGPLTTSATLEPVYVALVGTVPDPSITRVRVTLNGHTSEANVVAQYFAIAPPAPVSARAVTGSGTIVGFHADGTRVDSWPFSLSPLVDPCRPGQSNGPCHSTTPGS